MLYLVQDDDYWAPLHRLAVTQGITATRSYASETGDEQVWLVTSGTKPGVRYGVEYQASGRGVTYRCGCAAHKHNLPCKHASVVLQKLGLILAEPSRLAV